MHQSRRFFLKASLKGSFLAAAAAGALPVPFAHASARRDSADFSDRSSRLQTALNIRERASALATEGPAPNHRNNGEEHDYPWLASFTKGLKHNRLGEVDPDAWRSLAEAIRSGKVEDFERIPLNQRRLKNPLAGLTYEILGSDPTLFTIPPAPRLDSAANSAEMAELYWEALCRDISFTQYAESAITQEACADLSQYSGFSGPAAEGKVGPGNLFRGTTPGDCAGPYLSQFLLLDVPIGVPFEPNQITPLILSQKNVTIAPHKNYLTDYESWLHCNNGGVTIRNSDYDRARKYIRNGRDLANAVHLDVPWQFAINAAYILFNMKIPLARGVPYAGSPAMEGFSSYGYPHLMALLAEAGVRAGRAVWFQKWWVHRRLRPETFGGRLHNHLTRQTDYSMINSEIINSAVLERVFETNRSENPDGKGTFLLSQVYPEGCGLHPAYASGHAAMIGAAVTILKAWFDTTARIPAPVVPDAKEENLAPYDGPDTRSLTVGGELNKLASNISMGRNWAGIHWRSDAIHGMQLGEAVAIRLLREQIIGFPERAAFQFSMFDGQQASIH